MVITLFADAALPEVVKPDARVVSHEVLQQMQLEGERADHGRLELVSVKGQPFDQALRITTLSDPGREWFLAAIGPVQGEIEAGDVVLARFYLRCVESMTGDGFTGFVFDECEPPHDKAAELRVGAGKEWLKCFVPFRAKRDYRAGSARICFRAGFDRQTIEIGGIELVNYGPDADLASLPRTRITYAGRDPQAAWRRAALEQIEEVRKADLVVEVRDAQGHPVPDAQVHVKLKRHAFGFGSCVTADQITGSSADDERCREIIGKYFNRVVFENDMKWPSMWDGVPAKLDRAVDWLLERRIQIRGHNLQWPSWNWSPRQLRQHENDPQALRQRCAERIKQAVSHFKGKLIHWDVVNEPYNNTDLLEILGEDVLVEWFKLAKHADPNCRMYLNDFGIFDGGPTSSHRAHFYETIRWLKESGAPIDGIGIQSHFGAMVPPPTQLTAVLDRFAQFGLPIESTEFSINNDDRALQADFLRDYMIALFAHPKVEGIMHWGFWEARHWRPQAALWTRDWQLRPHGQVWVDLMERDWMTDESVTTDETGRASVRGFLGEYAVTVQSPAGRQIVSARLDQAGGRIKVQLPKRKLVPGGFE